jgi:hypothetical protein
VSGYVLGALILLALAFLAYRLILVRGMVRQYPWLYETAGPLSWRRRG